MRVTYDPIADTMYLYFSEDKKSTRTEEVGNDIVVDYSKNELIGIEILDASKKLSKKGIDSITLDIPTYHGRISRT